jgi:carboxypeptidase Taq
MKAYQALKELFEKLSHLEHLQAIATWDEAVMMPSGGGNARGRALSTLKSTTHELLTQERTAELLADAKHEKLGDSWDIANLRWMERAYTNASCLPSNLIKSITEKSIEAEQAWRSLRAENNWKDFSPYLENTFKLVKESATIRAEKFSKTPYDIMLDDFSPGIDQQFIDPIFSQLKKTLSPLIEQIIEKQKTTHSIPLSGTFPIEQQRQLGLELMQAIGFDFNRGRLDVSHHPFCGGVPEDVRITTRYTDNEFVSSAMGTCHETGHAKYEQGLPKTWIDQPVGRIHCMTMHESQSLLIEMQACRSIPFMSFVTPLVKRHFGEQEAFTAENLYRLYTTVEPGLIRVDADEVTYPLHVIIRYELEKALFADSLTIADLPDAWNEKMQQYLGLSTLNNDENGVMQDVHWPSGAFGYFPSYTLGSLTAAQLFQAAIKSNAAITEQLAFGNFSPLYEWLQSNVHSHASSKSFSNLMVDATGEALNPNYFIEHVKTRYL